MGPTTSDGKKNQQKARAAKVDHGGGCKPRSRREVTVVEVRHPQNQITKGNRMYTDYEISIKTTSKAFALHRSSVRRRYSDFLWLKKWLRDHNEGFGKKTPTLPPKKYIRRFDEDFIQERMKGLQWFLKKVIEYNVFLSDKALHLFLQSSLSIRQIEDHLQGKPLKGNQGQNHLDGNMTTMDSKPPSMSVSSFSSILSLSLEEIPEGLEKVSSSNSMASEGSASLKCTCRSEEDSIEFTSGRSPSSSASEDSSTEVDATLKDNKIGAIAFQVDSITNVNAKAGDSLPKDGEEVEVNVDTSALEISTERCRNTSLPDLRYNSELSLPRRKDAPTLEPAAFVSNNEGSKVDSDYGSESLASSDDGTVTKPETNACVPGKSSHDCSYNLEHKMDSDHENESRASPDVSLMSRPESNECVLERTKPVSSNTLECEMDNDYTIESLASSDASLMTDPETSGCVTENSNPDDSNDLRCKIDNGHANESLASLDAGLMTKPESNKCTPEEPSQDHSCYLDFKIDGSESVTPCDIGPMTNSETIECISLEGNLHTNLPAEVDNSKLEGLTITEKTTPNFEDNADTETNDAICILKS